MKTYRLDIRQLNIHRHNYLKEVFSFPDYYGHNFDAFYDCLSELRDITVIVEHPDRARTFAKKTLYVMEECQKTYHNLTVETVQ